MIDEVMASVPAEARIKVRSGFEMSYSRRSVSVLIAVLPCRELSGPLLSSVADFGTEEDVVESVFVFDIPK